MEEQIPSQEDTFVVTSYDKNVNIQDQSKPETSDQEVQTSENYEDKSVSSIQPEIRIVEVPVEMETIVEKIVKVPVIEYVQIEKIVEVEKMKIFEVPV